MAMASLQNTLLGFVLVILFVGNLAGATEYIVGDDRWDTSINYFAWSQKYNFTVGDVLLFKYVQGQHDVKLVTEATYRSCDTSSGVIRTYSSGNDRYNLTNAAKYWFLCSTKGHCKGGMRFGITVAATNAGDVGASPPAVTDLLPPPSVFPAGGSAASRRGVGWWGWWTSWCLISYWLVYLMSR